MSTLCPRSNTGHRAAAGGSEGCARGDGAPARGERGAADAHADRARQGGGGGPGGSDERAERAERQPGGAEVGPGGGARGGHRRARAAQDQSECEDAGCNGGGGFARGNCVYVSDQQQIILMGTIEILGRSPRITRHAFGPDTQVFKIDFCTDGI